MRLKLSLMLLLLPALGRAQSGDPAPKCDEIPDWAARVLVDTPQWLPQTMGGHTNLYVYDNLRPGEPQRPGHPPARVEICDPDAFLAAARRTPGRVLRSATSEVTLQAGEILAGGRPLCDIHDWLIDLRRAPPAYRVDGWGCTPVSFVGSIFSWKIRDSRGRDSFHSIDLRTGQPPDLPPLFDERSLALNVRLDAWVRSSVAPEKLAGAWTWAEIEKRWHPEWSGASAASSLYFEDSDPKVNKVAIVLVLAPDPAVKKSAGPRKIRAWVQPSSALREALQAVARGQGFLARDEP